MRIQSEGFEAGSVIPRRFTGEGQDISPPLVFQQVPRGTREIALICDDPDAPTPEPWVHWVLYKLSAATRSLDEGETGGGVVGKNSWGTVGYRGPLPPPGHGVHRYRFRVYALDTEPDLAPGVDKEELLGAMQGHVLAEAELVGTYERS